MNLPFSTMEEKELPHFKGGEGCLKARMFFDGTNRILMGRLTPGHTIGEHTHETNSEIIYVLRGTAHMVMDGQDELVTAGDVHYCPKGHTHAMRNDGTEDTLFFAVVPEHSVTVG